MARPERMLWFRIALAFGMSVRRCQEEIDTEFPEWKAFDKLNPIDHAARAELSAAIICQVSANLQRSGNQDAYKASDFMVDWTAEYRPPDEPENLRRKMENAIAAGGLAWESESITSCPPLDP